MASGLFSDFSLWHIPAVFVATAFTFGGLLPFISPARAMREYGLPERIANSQPAHTAFAIYGSRVSAYGLALWYFYLSGQYSTVDTLISLTFWWGAADLYVCLKAGAPGTAAWRLASSVLLSGWGYLGLTAKGSL
ncbi:hypothetical protein FVEN_g13061 [Fusarium venenatum]|uniref:Uncharacterized protein n=1 Tax=Fusarium venenatum TaxID=56646 RepID=A0A2L2T9W1_9HYPO|nr:uncharacterized protein FVRRES_05523 [Fusarium venenatum]KAG8350442.1 hypothetical protein FVEN_g13061 [Fusarium venenatum]KAH6992601.1 hypothetical protein EDB82DRAFT_497111 [Fusarium venenatum]CEI61087.1 unnamed protein product [Fusarium venenatum]